MSFNKATLFLFSTENWLEETLDLFSVHLMPFQTFCEKAATQ